MSQPAVKQFNISRHSLDCYKASHHHKSFHQLDKNWQFWHQRLREINDSSNKMLLPVKIAVGTSAILV